MTTPTANWSYPNAIRLGAGRIAEIADVCRDAGMNKPLLVTDRGLAQLPMTEAVLEQLNASDIECTMFSEVDPNPNEKNLEQGISHFKEHDHDGVIAFGGGSALDLGKLIALMANQTISVWDLEDVGDWWTRANSNAIHPIIAVPTTAGTGSEVGRAGVLTNTETKMKKIIFHPKLLPQVAICDPQLTVGMPPSITAGTGMDAFAHCLEAYCSPHYHPMSQGIALEGLRLVKENLLQAFRSPEDLEARAHMMSAALMGAVAFQKGLGAIHALSHPIGAVHNTHHGTTNAVVMKPVLNFNRSMIEDKMADVAGYLDIKGGFDGVCELVSEMNSSLGIPATLTELGVTEPDFELLTSMALEDPSVGGNPVEMTEKNTRALFETCM